MSRAKFILIVAFGLFSCCLMNAQDRTIDSLKSELNSNHEDPVLVKIYNLLGQKYLSIDSDSTIYYSKLALQRAKEIEHKQGQADALNYIAQAYIYLGQYDLAQKSGVKARDLYSKLNLQLGLAEVQSRLAVIQMYKGEYDSAITQSKAGLKLFEEQNDLRGQASCFNTLGNIAQKKGDYPLASEYLHKALTLHQKIGNVDGEAGSLNNIGVIYERQGAYQKALNNYHKSYLLCKEIGDELGVSIGVHNAGIILKKTGYYDSAIYNFKLGLALDIKIGALDGIVYDKKELGETYLLMNQVDTAYKYLHSALDMSVSFQDPVVTVPTMIGLGNIHRKYRNYDSAIYYLNLATEKAEKSELQNEKKDAVKSLYELYDEQGNIERAFHFFRIYTQIKDELFNEENIRRLALVEAEYKFEQRRNAQVQQTRLNDLEKDRKVAEAVWIRNTSIVGVLAISSLAFLIYYNYRRKRIANKKLNKLNEEIQNINASLETKINERTKQLQLSLDEVEVANQELDMFIYRSAHNLRAPVANMLGLCQLGLTDGKSNSNEYFIQLKETVEKMDSMLSHLQRANALKNRDLEISNINIRTIISDVLLRMNAPSTCRIKNGKGEIASCRSDAFLIDILVENIIENALKFSKDKTSELDIEIRPQVESKSELVVLFKDRGIGIEESIRDKIFDMFFRGIDKQGFGLGLYEARIIMQRLKGSIMLLESSEDGSTFEVRFSKDGLKEQ